MGDFTQFAYDEETRMTYLRQKETCNKRKREVIDKPSQPKPSRIINWVS